MADALDELDQHRSAGTPAAAKAPYAPRARPTACRKCHLRRVKCSGGKPCNNCRRANETAECVYPQKDRLVKVSQQYIDDLIAENQALRSRASSPRPRHGSQHLSGEGTEKITEETVAVPSTQAPELTSTPWFIDMAVPHTPILLSEASDSAFATRFRQAMSSSEHCHFPRVSYPAEDQILVLSDTACEWPSPPQARLLVNAALKCLGRWHHIVRSSVIFEELEKLLQGPRAVGFLTQSKFWALFAIGKTYSTRTSATPGAFPGLEYFAKASKVLRVISERPTVEMVETCLLLSYYSLFLNRRHSAYSLAGSAVRTAIIMGLHLNVPEPLLTDQFAREHRVRVWWTAYTFDRMWATKLGYPVAVQDSDIDLELPSNKLSHSDFPDCSYSVAMIGLARISGTILNSIYGKSSQKTALSQRVHDSLSALRQWLKDLPPSLQIDPTKSNMAEHQTESLHLRFDQLVILATRPVLLHVFRTRFKVMETGDEPDIPGSASTLSEACVRCARHSYQILTDSWINGRFMMFDYFYTQYLFTSATILAISSLLNQNGSQSDGELFDTAVQFLSQLKENGNFVAAEFKQHVDAMKLFIASEEAKLQERRGDNTSTQPQNNRGITGGGSTSLLTSQDVAADMVLSEPFFHDLLEQSIPDLDFIDASLSIDGTQGLYWPIMTSGTDSETFL
ncbi:Zn2Cys6 transcription factor [Trichoderma guizhouense]|uniref:Zn2Cys6 transcription factor n=1 Tax=Trichoderma guizhouense TaxID=1491466 RepID=A0A1T3CQZ8_9HYPO|nr:Zn2Cys6 transcription factor [Trichoderma guizhouense]